MGQAFNKLAGEHGAGNGEGHSKEAAVAKTAGFFVFSGIAMSILKALNSCNNNDNKLLTHSVTEPSQLNDPPHSREPVFKEKIDCTDKEVRKSTQKTIDIVKGDTLWGLSRKHGVSIDAIKEANGLTGDTIYAGKKLVIP
ncbi:probable N-acetylmuramidase [Vitis riparia]|uniref:probable N-acetylmuramidase n=1 Tax=Vitis riparia TaxID=96939 RepID=UPI00155B321A|nr:probable N-acetylmuramidase [Vitis riparia]